MEKALLDMGKDLEVSPPQLDHIKTAWWVHQLNHTNLDSLSVSTDQQAAEAEARNLGASAVDEDRKGKGKRVCQNTQHQARSPSQKERIHRKAHNLGEKKRRIKINEQLKELQELVPPGHTSSQASMLAQTVAYIKSMKGLLQMLSMMSLENAKAIEQYCSCNCKFP